MLKHILTPISCSILLAACNTVPTANQSPKMAVQKGIQPIISQSFDYNITGNLKTHLIIEAYKSDEKDKATQIALKSNDAAAEDLATKIFKNATLTADGSFNKEAQKLDTTLIVGSNLTNFGFKATVPFMIDFDKMEIIADLKDLNPLLITEAKKQRYPDYQNKYVRIPLGQKLNKAYKNFTESKTSGASDIKALFDNIEEKNFTYISLDKIDRSIGGKLKVRLDIKDLNKKESSIDADKSDVSDKIPQNKIEPILEDRAFIDFTLNASGDIIRVVPQMTNLKLGDSSIEEPSFDRYAEKPADCYSSDGAENKSSEKDWERKCFGTIGKQYQFLDISTDIKFKRFGQPSSKFNPNHADSIDIFNKKEVDQYVDKLGGNFISANQLTTTYNKLNNFKTATEASLFEGYVPVASQGEEKETKTASYKWIGWDPQDSLFDFSIKSPKNSTNLYLIATLSGDKFEPEARDAQIVLTRNQDGYWSCTVYRANNKHDELSEEVPNGCSFNKGKFTLPKK